MNVNYFRYEKFKDCIADSAHVCDHILTYLFEHILKHLQPDAKWIQTASGIYIQQNQDTCVSKTNMLL